MNGKEVTNAENGDKPLQALMSNLVKGSDEIAEDVIQAYKDLTFRYVRRMRIVPYPEFDFNSYPFMARIIVDELFAYAQELPKKEVKMFTGDITSEFYGSDLLFDKIREITTQQDIKFNIILAKPPVGQHLTSWRKLMTESSGKVRVRTKPQYSDELHHLILVGEDAYRKEAPHRDDDYEGDVTELEPKRPARFAFHDRSYAQANVLKHWETKVNTDDVEELPVD